DTPSLDDRTSSTFQTATGPYARAVRTFRGLGIRNSINDRTGMPALRARHAARRSMRPHRGTPRGPRGGRIRRSSLPPRREPGASLSDRLLVAHELDPFALDIIDAATVLSVPPGVYLRLVDVGNVLVKHSEQ